LEKTLAESIAQYRLQLGITGTDEEVANQLADIENQIKELEEKRRQIQKETDKWFNKIIPDFPLEGDSEDGVPWRVKTDDYEDQLKQLDGQLSALQDQQSKYHQLMDLQNQYHELDGIILSGIPEDGPTQSSIKNILGGCTNYVAIKRDISGFFVKGHMNANYWNENALAAGFEVGTRPVPGSIMVIEADNGLKNGIMSVDDTAGHVAYVEEITRGGEWLQSCHQPRQHEV
jgi:surface antigen